MALFAGSSVPSVLNLNCRRTFKKPLDGLHTESFKREESLAADDGNGWLMLAVELESWASDVMWCIAWSSNKNKG